MRELAMALPVLDQRLEAVTQDTFILLVLKERVGTRVIQEGKVCCSLLLVDVSGSGTGVRMYFSHV
jgi:hypothetical protein